MSTYRELPTHIYPKKCLPKPQQCFDECVSPGRYSNPLSSLKRLLLTLNIRISRGLLRPPSNRLHNSPYNSKGRSHSHNQHNDEQGMTTCRSPDNPIPRWQILGSIETCDRSRSQTRLSNTNWLHRNRSSVPIDRGGGGGGAMRDRIGIAARARRGWGARGIHDS